MSLCWVSWRYILTINVTTLNITTLSITAYRITTQSITRKDTKLSTSTLNAVLMCCVSLQHFHCYAQCHHGVCRLAECLGADFATYWPLTCPVLSSSVPVSNLQSDEEEEKLSLSKKKKNQNETVASKYDTSGIGKIINMPIIDLTNYRI